VGCAAEHPVTQQRRDPRLLLTKLTGGFMQTQVSHLRKNLHFIGRFAVGGFALLGTSTVIDLLTSLLPGYEKAIEAFIVIVVFGLVWVYLLVPALADLYPKKS
jgi:hypothetical protein